MSGAKLGGVNSRTIPLALLKAGKSSAREGSAALAAEVVQPSELSCPQVPAKKFCTCRRTACGCSSAR